MLSWRDFENSTDNKTDSFEKFCRLFFKFHFIKNKSINLNQKANHPGIETEPVTINGVRVGFQAKYFSNNVSYADILDSVEKVVKYYSGKIDKVILFCNKDINTEAGSFVIATNLLTQNNISLELFCNNSILDVVNITEEYSAIRALFFNRISLSLEWFDTKLKETLEELAPRYTSGFHVDMEAAQKHFEIIYRTDKVFDMLDDVKKTGINKVRSLHHLDEDLAKKVIDTISSLVVPEWDAIDQIFQWIHAVSVFDLDIRKRIITINSELKILYEKNDEKFGERYSQKAELEELLYIISSFDLSKNKFFKCLNSNLLVLEGNAGMGKSHLLGYEAEMHENNVKCRSLLLLGQKFVLKETPQKQIMSLLGLDYITFEQFLDYCEGLGVLNGTTTVIMIDAINECQESSIWSTYLNMLFEQIEKYSYIKMVCSIRTTYKQHFFGNKIKDSISKGLIPLISIGGFTGNLTEAIHLFFNYYKIPIEASDYLNREFENPLFLKIYCETYHSRKVSDKCDIYELFNCLFNAEEEKIKKINQVTDEMEYFSLIMNAIGQYFYDNNTSSIPLLELHKRLEHYNKIDLFIDGFLKAKIMVSYKNIKGKTDIYLGYERFADYIVAQYILNNTKNVFEIKKYARKYFLQLNDYNGFKNHFSIGRFAALSVLFRIKYNKELIIYAKRLLKKLSRHSYEALVSEYIDAYKFRSKKATNVRDYLNVVFKKFINTKTLVDKHIDLLVSMVGRDCELNANALTIWLKNKTLVDRDITWTCYINSTYRDGNNIFNLIQFFLKNKCVNINAKIKLSYGQALTWLLSSSNRKLRDDASRALVNLLQDDFAIMYELIKIFINVNDSYIVSRLFGCVYGAVLLSNRKTIDNEKYSQITYFIYREIFENKIVYPDILLRDYALNILEYANWLNIPMNFDIEKCRPPYKSFKIPNIDIAMLKKMYNENYEKNYGLCAIKNSMAPEHSLPGFTGMYGDFGRYIFESSLNGFKNVDTVLIFKYAYHYIVKSLGYRSSMFSEYDKMIGYGRYRGGSKERIGKKYQWIAMYHTLALVTDNFQYEEKYSNIEYMEYKGTWRPYVRDFDPTLRLNNSQDKQRIDCTLNRKIYSNWDEGDLGWAKDCSNGCSHKELIEMVDDKDCEWVALYFSETDKSVPNYDASRQELWKSSTACLVYKNEKNTIIQHLIGKNFYGRWLFAAEPKQCYSVFAHEYPWSPAYAEEIDGVKFNSAEIQVGTEKIVKKTPMLKFLTNYNTVEEDCIGEEFCLEEKEMEFEEPIYKEIGKILPSISFYLWEEERDCAKEETVSYVMPIKLIVDKLNLTQAKDGMWFKDDELACADFGLVEGSNFQKAFYIKKKFLKELLGNDLDIVWIGMGEKIHIPKEEKTRRVWNDLSSLAFYDENEILQEINHAKTEE